MYTSNRNSLKRFVMAFAASLALASAMPAVVHAQTSLPEEIGMENGEDQSGNLTAVNNLGQTIIGFILNVVAKVIGVAIAIWGITDFVKREVMWGTVKIFLCGACFFLNRIILAMSQLGGT